MAIGGVIRVYEGLRDFVILLDLRLQATLVSFRRFKLRPIFLIIFMSLRINNLIQVQAVLHHSDHTLINHHFQAKRL